MSESRSEQDDGWVIAADKDVAPLAVFYRVLVLLGPIVLVAVGLVGFALTTFIKRSDPVLIALVGASVGLMITGVLSPRLHGGIEVGLQGMKAEVSEFPVVLLKVAAAKAAAERALAEDTPDKERKVNEEVGRVFIEAIKEADSTPALDGVAQTRVPEALISAARRQIIS